MITHQSSLRTVLCLVESQLSFHVAVVFVFGYGVGFPVSLMSLALVAETGAIWKWAVA